MLFILGDASNVFRLWRFCFNADDSHVRGCRCGLSSTASTLHSRRSPPWIVRCRVSIRFDLGHQNSVNEVSVTYGSSVAGFLTPLLCRLMLQQAVVLMALP